MSTNPPQRFYPKIDPSIPEPIQKHLRYLWGSITDHDDAIVLLNGKVKSSNSSSTSSSSTTETSGVTQAQATTIANTQAASVLASTLGPVNNQTSTAYTLQSSDYGGVVTSNSTSAVTFTLNQVLQSQFFTGIENLGSGALTLQPGSGVRPAGTINGQASLTLEQNQGAIVYYDGTNWWAVTSPSLSASAVTSLNGETGAITLTSTGASIVITTPTSSTINLETASGSGGVTSLNTLTGAVTIAAGSNITVTVAGSTITIAASGGGGGGYLKGSVTIPCGGATSGFFVGTGTVAGAVPGQPVAACIDPNLSPGANVASLWTIGASVTAANTVEACIYIPAGGSISYNNVPVGVVVFP